MLSEQQNRYALYYYDNVSVETRFEVSMSVNFIV